MKVAGSAEAATTRGLRAVPTDAPQQIVEGLDWAGALAQRGISPLTDPHVGHGHG